MSNELIKVIVVILVCALLVTSLKSKLAEYSFLLLLAAISVVMITVFGEVFNTFSSLKKLFAESGGSVVYFNTALKAIGISYITMFASEICRDYGMGSLAQSAETAGKVAVFLLSIPLMNSVLDAALKFAGL